VREPVLGQAPYISARHGCLSRRQRRVARYAAAYGPVLPDANAAETLHHGRKRSDGHLVGRAGADHWRCECPKNDTLKHGKSAFGAGRCRDEVAPQGITRDGGPLDVRRSAE
jgi:hypothetical protein